LLAFVFVTTSLSAALVPVRLLWYLSDYFDRWCSFCRCWENAFFLFRVSSRFWSEAMWSEAFVCRFLDDFFTGVGGMFSTLEILLDAAVDASASERFRCDWRSLWALPLISKR
jgi:hypothetical protein